LYLSFIAILSSVGKIANTYIMISLPLKWLEYAFFGHSYRLELPTLGKIYLVNCQH